MYGLFRSVSLISTILKKVNNLGLFLDYLPPFLLVDFIVSKSTQLDQLVLLWRILSVVASELKIHYSSELDKHALLERMTMSSFLNGFPLF